MPRTVTYYDTAEVIAMLEADHEREFEVVPRGVQMRCTASYIGGKARIIDAMGYLVPMSVVSGCRDWRLTKGKP